MKVRKIHGCDWDSVMRIQAESYPVELLESKDALLTKQQSSPDTCFVIEGEGFIAGYFLSVPYQLGEPPPLDSHIMTAADGCNLHIHDFCLSSRYRNCGYGKNIVNRLLMSPEFARFKTASLVSVMGSLRFWQSIGFSRFRATNQIDLSSYGEQAAYLSMRLS